MSFRYSSAAASPALLDFPDSDSSESDPPELSSDPEDPEDEDPDEVDDDEVSVEAAATAVDGSDEATKLDILCDVSIFQFPKLVI